MRNAKKEKFNVWQAATLYLTDHQSELSAEVFNKFSGALRARDVRRICSIELHPNIGMRPFQILTQVQGFFSKNSSFSDSNVCEAQAIQNFHTGEKLCKITNKRLRYYSKNPERCKFASDLQVMRDVIGSVLGSVDHLFREFTEHLRFTSGATESHSKIDSAPVLKMRRTMSVSSAAVPLVLATLKHLGVIESDSEVYPPKKDAPLRLRLTDFNRVAFVPKNYKTHRSIAAEADLNLPFQLAIDHHIKAQLRRVGIDLGSQKRNVDLARKGSIDGSVATIDLSMASDTLSYELVKQLFPVKWYQLLDMLRAKGYKLKGEAGLYHKFSSMGNGFTFPVETLVFYAACKAAGSDVACVYGDDIIVETECAQRVISILRFIGFRTNKEKTFVDGKFRESCGADFYEGTNIRPFFIRKSENLNLMELSHVINGLVRVGAANGLLWNYLRRLTLCNNIHLVPSSELSGAGVHIDVSSAYRFGKLRYRFGVTSYRGYSEVAVSPDSAPLGARSRLKAAASVKGYIFTSLAHQVIVDKAVSARITLREYALLFKESNVYTNIATDRKVVTSWRQFDPSNRPPIHLYLWTDFLSV